MKGCMLRLAGGCSLSGTLAPRFKATLEEITNEAGSIATNINEKMLLLTWHESSETTKEPFVIFKICEYGEKGNVEHGNGTEKNESAPIDEDSSMMMKGIDTSILKRI
ncbi:hypothetical protein Tco_0559322 [Tanacetum coccineum]